MHETVIVTGPPASLTLIAEPEAVEGVSERYDRTQRGRPRHWRKSGRRWRRSHVGAPCSVQSMYRRPARSAASPRLRCALMGLLGRPRSGLSIGGFTDSVVIPLRPGPPGDIALDLSPSIAIVGSDLSIGIALTRRLWESGRRWLAGPIIASAGRSRGGMSERVVAVRSGIADAVLRVDAAIGPLRIEAYAVEWPEVRTEQLIRSKRRCAVVERLGAVRRSRHSNPDHAVMEY